MSAKLKGQESAELCSLSCRCSLHLHVLVQKLLNTAQVLSQQSVMWSDWNSTIVFKQQRPFYPLGHDLLDLHTHTQFSLIYFTQVKQEPGLKRIPTKEFTLGDSVGSLFVPACVVYKVWIYILGIWFATYVLHRPCEKGRKKMLHCKEHTTLNH